VERIAHYAVIELAVGPAGQVSQNDADFFFGLTLPGVLFLFGVLVSVHTSDVWDFRFGGSCHTWGMCVYHVSWFACFYRQFCVRVKLIIPPWPMFNQHPVTWLPPKEKKEKKQ